MSNVRIIRSSVCSGFGQIGTKVIAEAKLMEFVEAAAEKTDFAAQDTPGQAYVPLPEEACSTVSCGVGRHTHCADDYLVRVHRGQVGVFLKRKHAAPVESLAVILYTREAYLADPDLKDDPEEHARVESSEATHVLVTILASAGPKPPVGPWRFVHNLAGGNRSYEPGNTTVEKLREEAQAIQMYHCAWCTVAD